MIPIKSPSEIERMRRGGRITAAVLQEVLAAANPGVTLLELEKIARDGIARRGGSSAFQRVEGYKFATCLNVNEGVVHGIPTERRLQEGDILSVDLGTFYRGFNTDAAWTVYVGDLREAPVSKLLFLKTGKEALRVAIAEARAGKRVFDISAKIQQGVEKAGYTPVDTLVGHGVGRELHEDPQIPCLVIKGSNPKLKAGMALAIEVIYTERGRDLRVAEDGWTVETVDKSLSGLFEHTVVITEKGPEILTDSTSSPSTLSATRIG
uniref:Methionine aminopeptidase n=1 Tax=candidate division WWE3 bacterium TaxID=2053526 RepID=A0A831Z0G2_UNCKA